MSRERKLSVLLVAFLVLVTLPSAATAKATKWTPDTFHDSLQQKPGTAHLLKLYAPWCGHCKKMAPAFDETAAVLTLKGIQVGKVDCADKTNGGKQFCAGLGVTGFPSVKLFLGDKKNKSIVDFPGKDRTTAAMVAFALGGHERRPRRGYEVVVVEDEKEVGVEDEAAEEKADETGEDAARNAGTKKKKVSIKLTPKTGFEKVKDVAADIVLDVVAEVFTIAKETPAGGLAIFAAAFFTALFGIVITDSVSERLGVPRRGETWEDVSLRRDWEVARETVLGKKKANGKKTE